MHASFQDGERNIELRCRALPPSSFKCTIKCPFVPRDVTISDALKDVVNEDNHIKTYALAACGVGGILLYGIEVSHFAADTAQLRSQPVVLALLDSTTSTCKVTFSNSGMLGSASTSGHIAVWDVNMLFMLMGSMASVTIDRDESGRNLTTTNKFAPTWEAAYHCGQITALEFSPSGHWLAAACLGRAGEIILIEQSNAAMTHLPNSTWMHSCILCTIVPHLKSTQYTVTNNNMGTTTMHCTDVLTHSGLSLLVWWRNPSAQNEILIGVHGPTQRWMAFDPVSCLSYRKYVRKWESIHRSAAGSVASKDILQSLSIEMSTNSVISVTRDGKARTFEL